MIVKVLWMVNEPDEQWSLEFEYRASRIEDRVWLHYSKPPPPLPRYTLRLGSFDRFLSSSKFPQRGTYSTVGTRTRPVHAHTYEYYTLW